MRDHVASDRGHVRHDRGGGVRDHALDAADVVRDARLHLARARAREEGERQPLEVPVDGRAEVVHHALADLVGQQRLVDASAPVTMAIAIIPPAAIEAPVAFSEPIASSARSSRRPGGRRAPPR